MKITAQGVVYHFKPARTNTRKILNSSQFQGHYYSFADSVLNIKYQPQGQ